MTTRPLPPAPPGSDTRQALPPGPRGLPVLGNVLQMASSNIIERYTLLWREYGDIVHVKLGPRDGYILFHPDFVYHALVKNAKNYAKGIGYDGLRLLVGNGLLTSEGETWRQQRRLMQPPFTPTAVTQFAAMMGEATRTLLDRWQPLAEQGGTLVLDDEMRRLTMSIIGRAMFSIDLSEEMTQVGDALQEAFGFVPTRTTSVVPLSLPLPSHRRFRTNLALIDEFVNERIADGRRNPDRENLLSILLRATDEETGQRMDEAQLRDEVVTLFFAGFETTARSLTWAWYLLARHPWAQGRMQGEVDRVRGAQPAAAWLPSVGDLYQLGYTRQVIDETLRIYPPTALLARQNTEADAIGGYPIPAGSMIILMPYMVHRHPEVWDDPERFDPERFTAAAVEERPKSAYIPFASGPRVCLGNNFALLEMIYALSMASARYTIEAVDDTPIEHEFGGTIRPNHPLVARITARPTPATA